MTKILKNFLRRFISLFPLNRYIVFESVPDMDGSPWMIYQEMKKRKLDKVYKLVWAVDEDRLLNIQKTQCIPLFNGKKFFQKLRAKWVLSRARVIIDSNRYVHKIHKKTFRLYTNHGASLKQCYVYSLALGQADCVLTLSDEMKLVDMDSYRSAQNNIYVLGYPCHDSLFEEIDLYENGFWFESLGVKKRFSKIIGWLPTFRQHKKNDANDCQHVLPLGIPLLQNKYDLDELNRFLQIKNVLLAIQIHHAQLKNFVEKKYSNIVFISPQIKTKKHVSTMNLMHCFDALITDYSGAYHEFLLLNRPIALSIDDIDAYQEDVGFVVDYFNWIKGVYLKDKKDLINFIQDVYNGIDRAKAERISAMHRIHKYIDNHSAERVVDFLCDKAKL